MKKLSQEEIYLSLTDKQKEFLDYYVQRGKKTKWLNAWAKTLGSVLSQDELENPEKAMENLLEWILIEYEDNYVVNGSIRCECGRALRHRYTVLHKPTGKIYRLGIVHFKQHTGLEPDIIRLITKGLKEIDLERDEILDKVGSRWKLPVNIPIDFEMPGDMQKHIDIELPLLDRQIRRLNQLLKEHNEKLLKEQKEREQKQQKREQERERQALLSINPKTLYNKIKDRTISSTEAKDLFRYLQQYPEGLKEYGITIEEIKTACTKTLGYTKSGDIRNWLVEIEYL